MKVLNYGSINIDLVYRVHHISRPGETISSLSLARFAGGKGNNQSIALAKAGAPVFHAGKIGSDGEWIRRNLRACGADVRFIRKSSGPTGHAVIQVADNAQNSIVLFPGANRQNTRKEAVETISHFGRNDILLLQNEINEMPFIMRTARAAGMVVWFNPAPFGKEVMSYPLKLVDVFIVNEIEGAALAGTSSEKKALQVLADRFPRSRIIMTLGARGALYRHGKDEIFVPAPKVNAVDTTAAGDCFIGYFVASVMRNLPVKDCLRYACRAASISVTRKGAANSIPGKREVFGK